MGITLPNDTQRMVIVGATGSGKTQAAMWHVSMRDFNVMPWIVFDFKHDEMINEAEGTQEIQLSDPIPEQPGIYIVHPHPSQTPEVEAMLWRIWERGNVGVYIDEGYMISDGNKVNRALRAILTQGRSKRIPVIVLSQRPTWIDRFIFSESEFFQIFRLSHSDDLKTVNKFIPFDLSERLPEYRSYYYEVPGNRIVVMGAVPDRDTILDTIEEKLKKIKKVV